MYVAPAWFLDGKTSICLHWVYFDSVIDLETRIMKKKNMEENMEELAIG